MVMIRYLLIVVAALNGVNASIFALPRTSRALISAAAIFGFGKHEEPSQQNGDPQQGAQQGTGGEAQDGTQQQQQQQQQSLVQTPPKFQPPPPPPGRQLQMPPPPPRAGAKLQQQQHEQQQQALSTTPTETTAGQETSEVVPPPPLMFPPQQQQQQQPPPQQQDGTPWQPDPSLGGDWVQGAYAANSPPWLGGGDPLDTDQFYLIQQDLEASMQREFELSNQLQNVTATLAAMEQREELHIRQMDVLTERVMDVESQASQEHNQLLEYQANCSAMDLEIAELRGEVEEWKQRCLQADEHNKKQRSEQGKLVKKLEKANREAENLATRIERHRLEDIRQAYQERRKRAAHKRVGWFGWLFGGGGRSDRDDDALNELEELAKATLLNALQTERSNVEELETTVSTLQQNNSVIAMQVKSRDEIIDELNERVAVFEEDKVVLKAALKQLQKEMAEEAPKTQKLIDDLGEAQTQIEQLESDLDAVTEQQQEKVASLEVLISEKQDMIHQTEANVTLISEYVDKLEERLADFALARRDIDKRQARCLEIETKAVEVEQECSGLREQIQANVQEHEELKSLMNEMVVDRTSLQQQLATLTSEKQKASQQMDRLKASLESLQQEHALLQKKQKQQPPPPPPPPPGAPSSVLQAQIQEYEARMAQLLEENSGLQAASANADSVIAELRDKVDAMLLTKQELESLLQQAQSTKDGLEERLQKASEAQQSAEQRLEQANQEYEIQLDAVKEEAKAQLAAQRADAESQLAQEEQKFQEQLALELEKAASFLREEKERMAQLLQEEQDKSAANLEMLAQQQQPAMPSPENDEKAEHIIDTDEPVLPEREDGDSSDDEAELVVDIKEPELPPASTTTVDRPAADEKSETKPENDLASDASVPNRTETRPPKLSQNMTAPTDNRPGNRTAGQVAKRKPGTPPGKQKSVGRSFRKFFAQGTGLHGFFSHKYQKPPPPHKRPPPTLINRTATRPPPRDPAGAKPNNRGPKQMPPPKTTATREPRVPPQQPRPGPERGSDPPGAVPPSNNRGPGPQQPGL